MVVVLDKYYNLIGKFKTKEQAIYFVSRIDQLDENEYHIYE
jgi:hypothetical protein